PPTASVASIRTTPEGRYIILNLNFPEAKDINTIVPSYFTEKGYVENIPSRSLVGDQQSTSQWIRIDSKTGETKPFQMMLEEGKESKRSIRLSELSWNEEGTRANAYARATDNKDEWILAMDLDMAQGRILYSHQDKAWIGGPGAFVFGWINNEEIYFESEASGWAHLYRMSYRGGKPVALTSGSWEVQSVTLMPNKKDFLLVTNEKHHGEKQVYLLSVNGGERRPLSNTTGFHEPYISPDGKTMADLASSANRPPEIFIKQLNTNKLPIQITKSISNDFESRPWIIPPVLTFTARDGAQVPARLYKPTQWKAGGPAVLFIHGAGYLQNAHKGWSTYPREYMFHHFLMEQGYLVLDIDYRGSSGYGRDWRTAISTFMGGKDLDDAVDAARWMTSEFQVDPKRIGIYGGSYGGFITLMAMFTKPDVFNAGAALRPVTDWAHYNHGYTSNILGEPQKESEAYRRSSPIYHAQGLQGALLICHGVIDTNVHFQDSVRLAQKLIELRKENWELALYPAEDHGFREATSWADEFKRIFKLFENNLK
ncbi:MAG: S9 family peptidase, partial [Holophagaceae bacterium]